MATLLYEHIELDERGVAWIPEANTKVREIVLSRQAYGYSPEEMVEHFPHLTLAGVHAALAYYYDHQAQIDAEIEESARFVERMRAEAGPQPTRAEWEARFRARAAAR